MHFEIYLSVNSKPSQVKVPTPWTILSWSFSFELPTQVHQESQSSLAGTGTAAHPAQVLKGRGTFDSSRIYVHSHSWSLRCSFENLFLFLNTPNTRLCSFSRNASTSGSSSIESISVWFFTRSSISASSQDVQLFRHQLLFCSSSNPGFRVSKVNSSFFQICLNFLGVRKAHIIDRVSSSGNSSWLFMILLPSLQASLLQIMAQTCAWGPVVKYCTNFNFQELFQWF